MPRLRHEHRLQLSRQSITTLDRRALETGPSVVVSTHLDAVLSCYHERRLRPARGVAEREAEQVEVRLTEAELAEKLATARRYRTQIDQHVCLFGEFVDEAGLGREVLWTAVVGDRSPGYARPKR